MTIKGLLFDKDGTLIDFQKTWGRATGLVLAELSGGDPALLANLVTASAFDPLTDKIGQESVIVGGSLNDIANIWGPVLGRPFNDEFEHYIDELYRGHSRTTLTPFADTVTSIAAFHKSGYRLGVATNDSEATARIHVDLLGLDGHFDMILGYDSGHGAKPRPGMIEAFATAMDLNTGEIAMVGDSAHDLNAARAAGAVAIAVNTGLAPASELAPLADHIVADLTALTGLIVSHT